MKKFIFLITFIFSGLLVTAQTDTDSIRAEIGEIQSFQIQGDTVIITNTNKEQFVLVAENAGQLVATLLNGIEQVKEGVEGTEKRPIDYLMEVIKWLLGGSLASVIAIGTRTLVGIRDLFSKIQKNISVVIVISGALSFAWMLVQGGQVTETGFWTNFGVTWFSFSMFAVGLYETVLKKIFGKTPKTAAEKEAKMMQAADLLVESGHKVLFAKTEGKS